MFFLPLRDHPNPEGFRPWVTWLLIAVNVVVYLLLTLPESASLAYGSTTAYDLRVQQWGFRPVAPEGSDVLTSMFLHAGWLHLAGNMLFLWIYGDNVEHRLGRLRYLLAYLGTGAAAVAGHALLNVGSEVPMVGASGAISGVLGIYFLWFKHHRVEVLGVVFPFWFGRIHVPARVLLGAYVVLDNLLPLLTGPGDSVAYGAHLGGFFAGLLAAALIFRGRRPPPGRPDGWRPAPLPGGLQRQSGWGRRVPGRRRPRY